MTEDFLHYIWKYRLLDNNLVLSSGEPLAVLDPGMHNRDAGPDFFNARLKIGETTWAGNVEVHIRSSDWHRHGHHGDAAYDSVVLHVVFTADEVISRKGGDPIPTLEVDGMIDYRLVGTYQQLMHNRSWIPCAHLFHGVDRVTLHGWLDRMVVERYDRKSREIARQLAVNQYDWNETIYHFLARSFGFNVNTVPFQMLARITPLALIRKHRGDLFRLEALFFGQSGMLSLPGRGKYFRDLKREYGFLREKHNLVPMEPHVWKFLRMRPLNFPTLRIGQFAALLNSNPALFTPVLEAMDLSTLESLFSVSAPEFWDTRYSFSSRSPRKAKRLGAHAVGLLIINTVVPFLYLYGKLKDRKDLLSRGLRFLDQLPAEKNSIVSGWRSLGVAVRSAYTSQALIELKNRYCRRKRCLECAIGNTILGSRSSTRQ